MHKYCCIGNLKLPPGTDGANYTGFGSICRLAFSLSQLATVRLDTASKTNLYQVFILILLLLMLLLLLLHLKWFSSVTVAACVGFAGTLHLKPRLESKSAWVYSVRRICMSRSVNGPMGLAMQLIRKLLWRVSAIKIVCSRCWLRLTVSEICMQPVCVGQQQFIKRFSAIHSTGSLCALVHQDARICTMELS